jgi:hypothetical protein
MIITKLHIAIGLEEAQRRDRGERMRQINELDESKAAEQLGLGACCKDAFDLGFEVGLQTARAVLDMDEHAVESHVEL